MPIQRIVGIVLIVVGLLLIYFGWQSTESLTEQAREEVTGRYSDETTWYLVGGAAAAVAGLLLTVFGGRKG
ncbi:drug/metabolite transporter (DMT)-like permease [Natronospira proteinivora]|uniref:Drug/metabolite transporter (DMT)-like permease n=1 Tax=Natronospira proteinivora TaxID=1807133 RepID=A0ABT1G4P7_9GAMM|nr:DUF3185 family protein [Natronospira proteinivora]MCP1726256.1 drug/metabolite transporter (DMT)-like permease [Natronospira proteinivora]